MDESDQGVVGPMSRRLVYEFRPSGLHSLESFFDVVDPHRDVMNTLAVSGQEFFDRRTPGW